MRKGRGEEEKGKERRREKAGRDGKREAAVVGAGMCDGG